MVPTGRSPATSPGALRPGGAPRAIDPTAMNSTDMMTTRIAGRFMMASSPGVARITSDRSTPAGRDALRFQQVSRLATSDSGVRPAIGPEITRASSGPGWLRAGRIEEHPNRIVAATGLPRNQAPAPR